MDRQTKDFYYFLAFHDELLREYPNKHLVIQDKKVCFAADTEAEAISKAEDAGMELGTYIVQLCTAGDRAYIINERPRYAACLV